MLCLELCCMGWIEEICKMGLFIEKISYLLTKENVSIPMIGLKGNENIIEKLQHLL